MSVVIIMAIFALDDLWIDLLAILKKSKPRKLTNELREQIWHSPEKRIAIMIANWKEADVIENMILGNLGSIDYQNYVFFLGVYPNDPETRNVALKLALHYEQVVLVINSRPGPTSKGQMLNECVRAVTDWEKSHGKNFDILMMHDSEDVIHPYSLKLISHFMNKADFIQIPVYSFDLAKSELVGATYLDEFSDHHSKEMILRSDLGQAVPSAGTGTAMSRKFVQQTLMTHDNQLFKEDTLTEDYHLGHSAHRSGFRTQFLCYYSTDTNGKRDFIATREYFPKTFGSSIRQKTRWCIGIIFQGAKNLNWSGNLMSRYFLWRDRRGLWNALLILASLPILVFFTLTVTGVQSPLEMQELFAFKLLISFVFISLMIRVLRRMQAVAFVNTPSQALWVPIRWPLANIINVTASVRAWRDYRRSQKRGEAPRWVKTQHELPKNFGRVLPSAALLAKRRVTFAVETKIEEMRAPEAQEVSAP